MLFFIEIERKLNINTLDKLKGLSGTNFGQLLSKFKNRSKQIKDDEHTNNNNTNTLSNVSGLQSNFFSKLLGITLLKKSQPNSKLNSKKNSEFNSEANTSRKDEKTSKTNNIEKIEDKKSELSKDTLSVIKTPLFKIKKYEDTGRIIKF